MVCSELYSWSNNNDTSTLVTSVVWNTRGPLMLNTGNFLSESELKCEEYSEAVCIVVSYHFSFAKHSLSHSKIRPVDES